MCSLPSEFFNTSSAKVILLLYYFKATSMCAFPRLPLEICSGQWRCEDCSLYTLLSPPIAESSKDSLSLLVSNLTSCSSCAEDDPILIKSRTAPISLLRLRRVHLDATPESTAGVVILTRVRGYKRYIYLILSASVMYVYLPR